MKTLWSRFKTNSFLVSFSMLASGSIIAQLISIIISPITSRLFTPEQFGSYTTILTAVSLFGPVICLKYDMSIIVAKTENETFSIIKLCLILIIPFSIIISVLYGIIFLSNDYTSYSLMFPILGIASLLILYGLNIILVSHNNKNGLYELISSVTVIKSLVNSFFMILSGFLRMGIFGLVGSQLLSSFVGVGRQSVNIRNNYQKFKDVDSKSIKRILFDHRDQPLYNASTALISTSIYSSINLFIKSFFSTTQLGLYSFSYRVLGIPFSVISANVARIFFNSSVKEKYECGNYKKTFIKTLKLLIMTIVPIIAIMAVAAPWLFSTVFGSEWQPAGNYVRILAPMFAARLIAESLTTSFIVSNRQHIEMYLQISLLFGEVIIYYFTYSKMFSIELFLGYISFLYVVIYCVMILIMYNLSKGETK